MNGPWMPFDVLEFLDKRSLPRRWIRRFFEINPLGQVRYLDPNGRKYITIKPATHNKKPYFMAPVGWSMGNLIVARFPLEDLVKRFFNT